MFSLSDVCVSTQTLFDSCHSNYESAWSIMQNPLLTRASILVLPLEQGPSNRNASARCCLPHPITTTAITTIIKETMSLYIDHILIILHTNTDQG
jgi:hypothetical protein